MSGYDVPGHMREPQDIYQDWLDLTSEALLTGDVGGFCAHVSLPFVMRTTAGETVLETPQDLAGDVQNVVEALRGQRVTNYVRLVKHARYLDAHNIEGWHTTYVLRHAVNVVEPYGNRMVLRLIDGAWKVTEADHELGGNRIPTMLLRSQPGAMSDTWEAAKADLRATYARAEPIYQIFLDSFTRTVMERDFDAWVGYFTMPHEIHYDETDRIAERPEDVRPFFDLLIDTMDRLGADRLERHARHAEFLNGDRILGYHDAALRRQDEVVLGPIRSRMMLCQKDGAWKCSSVTNSLSENSVPKAEFMVTDGLPTMREIQERMKK